jgi:hypothetical protein
MNNSIDPINNLTKLEAMLMILLEATSTRQVSYTHILLDFFRLEVMPIDSVISPVTYELYSDEVIGLTNQTILDIISKKLKLN